MKKKGEIIMESKKWGTFSNYNDTISVKCYLGNAHGVHAVNYPLTYEEIKDIPDDIIFRVTRSYMDSAYARISKMPEKLKANNTNLITVIETIYKGILFKGRKTMCHTNLATAKSVKEYLKYIDTKSTIKEVIPGIVNYDKFLSYISNKTGVSITNDIEQDIYTEILSLKDINNNLLLNRINSLDNSLFKKNALLLLKATIYNLEDQHYQKNKEHNSKELKLIKE